MNKETKKIRDGRMLNGEQLPKYPERLVEGGLENVSLELVESMNRYYEATKDSDLDGQIMAIVENIYIVLNAFSNMGIQPDYLVRIILKYKLGRAWDNKSLSLKNNPIEFYSEIREELQFMQAPNYFGGEAGIGEDFIKMQETFEKLNINHSIEPTMLASNLAQNYYFSNLNALYNYRDSLDIDDDVRNLIEILYNNLYTLVQMGVNPEKYLDNLINEKMNNQLRKR